MAKDKKPAIYSFTPLTNQYTPAGIHGDVTVFRLKDMTPKEIEDNGLQSYVREGKRIDDKTT